jgi:DNA recombination protein RmuC
MPQLLSIILIVLNLAVVVLLIILLTRHSGAKENQERTERIVKDEIAQNRNELNSSLKSGLDTFLNQIASLTKSNEDKLERMRTTVEERLKLLQDDNSQKLEKMRITVDEKLHSTLEKRLGESFKIVSERLELVHKGLGEMQALASGVGDLKKVLTNVKTRGTWGEIQLGSLLEQILTPEQYTKNVATKKGSNERVEFAIKLPSKDKDDRTLWLPIDAKFPLEDYQKLIEVQEQANICLVDELGKMLENRIKAEAKDIKEKYIDPPNTTDFGILFLPVEGLYAEVLRRPGLCDLLQREYRVIITGPTTLWAILNGYQMGFRSLAIAKRSSEIWAVLGAIKTEFSKFGEMLDKTQKKLQEASNTIDDATKKSRTIEKRLNKVQELPLSKSDMDVFGEIEKTEQ